MTKRFLILTLAAAIAAATAGAALAGKPAVLFPGGTYLNQAATSGLSCVGGASAASGTTTFIVSVPLSQSTQGVTLNVDYNFDPDDAALPTYSGGTVVRAQAPSGAAVQTVPISIPVTSDDGAKATVVNASVISITSGGVLLFDAASLASWSCGAVSTATGGGSGAGCVAAGPMLAQLIQETAGTKGELQKKAIEAQRECAKGHMKEAAHKMGDFLKELSHQASKLSPASVARWSEMATAIRAALIP